MALLDTGIASIFQQAFAGIYLPATLYRRELTYDDGGSPTYVETEHSCRAQRDSASEAMRSAPGYTERQSRVLILSNSLDVQPTTNDQVRVAGEQYAIMRADTDPANSYWDCVAERA